MDRLARFTIPGIAFICALCYFIFTLSGYNILSSSNDNLLTLVAGVLSTPVIGLVVTSILHGILHRIKVRRRPGPYWLFLPRAIEPEVLTELSNGSEPTNETEWKQFYWKYQQIFRSREVNEKVIDFTANRWTYYFVLVNTAFAIAFGIVLSILIVWLQFDFYTQIEFLLPGLVVSILFSSIAIWLSLFSLNDAREVEHLDVLEKLRLKRKELGSCPTNH